MAAAAFIALVFVAPSRAAYHVLSALHLCASSVIPSLFPLTVVAEAINRSRTTGVGAHGVKKVSKHTVIKSVASHVPIGAICGFPAGCRSVGQAYEKGELSQRDAETLLGAVSYPSLGFTLFFVGQKLNGNLVYGLLVHVVLLAAGLAYLICARQRAPRKEQPCTNPIVACGEPPRHSVAEILALSIRAAASSLLGVCANVAFFSCVAGLLSDVLSPFTKGVFSSSVLRAFFELTSGAASLSVLPPRASFVLTCAACAWSGLSTHMQTVSVCANYGLSTKKYFAAKALQTIVAAAVAAALSPIAAPLSSTEHTSALSALANASAACESAKNVRYRIIFAVLIIALSPFFSSPTEKLDRKKGF